MANTPKILLLNLEDGQAEDVNNLLNTNPRILLLRAVEDGNTDDLYTLLNTDPEKRLLKAVKDGNTDDLKTLLNDHPNTLQNDHPNILQKFTLRPKEDTPLHIAASVGKLKLVESIIKEKPSFAWDKNKYGLTPLHIASAIGHLGIVEALLGLASESLCHLQDDLGRTPLHYAAMNGEKEVFKRLAKECPETLLTSTTDKETPLRLARRNNDMQSTITALIEELDWYNKLIFKGWSFIKDLDNPGKNLYFKKEGRRAQLGLGKLLINFISHTDDKTLQVVATLIATMSFQAVVRPPESIWEKDKNKLDYGCVTMKHGFGSFIRCPALSYLLFLLSNTAGFLFASLLLLTFRKGLIAEILLRASMIFLVFSYSLLLISLTPKDYLVYFISGFLLIILYAVLLLDWLRKNMSLRTNSTQPNNVGNEQASPPVQERIDHQT